MTDQPKTSGSGNPVRGDNDSVDTDRRSFLTAVSLGTVAGGAALVTGTVAEASTHPEGNGYRETEHVRTYYNLARF